MRLSDGRWEIHPAFLEMMGGRYVTFLEMFPEKNILKLFWELGLFSISGIETLMFERLVKRDWPGRWWFMSGTP
jgi:hypothetical protein